MWPLLLLSLIAATVVVERLFFLFQETRRTRPEERAQVLRLLEEGKSEKARERSTQSSDFVVRSLHSALLHLQDGSSEAFMYAAQKELLRFKRGLSVLDTAITLAPLLGLLGTVTGMITAFGMISGELGAPSAITGGIAEALIATAYGLGVAILSLIPFNTLNARYEKAQYELEEAGTRLEIILSKLSNTPATPEKTL